MGGREVIDYAAIRDQALVPGRAYVAAGVGHRILPVTPDPGRRGGVDVRGESLRRILEALRAKLGLNRPIYIQYGVWLGQLAQGDLGESLWTKRPVLEELTRRLPVSAELGAMAIVFGLCIALPIGVLAAIRQDTMKDYAARSLAIIGLSMPGFWKATVIIVFTSIWFGWASPVKVTPFMQSPGSTLANSSCPRSFWRSAHPPASCA